jgi:hypothetical protein
MKVILSTKLTHCATIFEYVNNDVTLMLLIWKFLD